MSNQQLDALITVRRSDWNAKERPRPLTPVDHPYLEIHHTGHIGHYSRAPLGLAKDIETDHLKRGWNGPFYGLMIATDGRIIELRGAGWRSIGTHKPRYNDNTPVDPAALCIVLPGDYTINPPTNFQIAALDRIRATLPDPRLRWHNMRDATSCPGNKLIVELQRLNHKPLPDLPPLPANEETTMFIARRPDNHHVLTDGFRQRTFRNWEEMTKYRDQLGLKVVDLSNEEFAQLQPAK